MRQLKNGVGSVLIFVAILLAGCGTSKMVVSYQANAEKAEAEGNYAAATEAWSLFFNQQSTSNADIPAATYAKAAKVAYKADRFDLAENWFEQARRENYADPLMYIELADIYKKQDNLSKELVSLEFYRDTYSLQQDSAGIASRLFEIYAEIGQDQNADVLWSMMDGESRETELYLSNYFGVQRRLKNEEVADSVAQKLLVVNPKHVAALEWLGEKYYRMAEDRYQREMKAYEKKRTHLQHHHLLQELKIVSADFQKSLRYFEVLWEINPGKRYAAYMANIYTRFENPEKASYYRKFSE